MNPFDPFNFVNLSGYGTMRIVTLVLPAPQVRNLLPNGLELGPQTMTPPGTHPVILCFHDMFRLHMSIPAPLPSLSYREHSVGVPHTYVTDGAVSRHSPGPYYYCPVLLLDSLLAILGGVVFWGYTKRIGRFTVDAERYTVSRGPNEPVISLSWQATGPLRPVGEYPLFAAQQQALGQPLLGMWPMSLGPLFQVADFPKRWDTATLRPFETVTEIHSDYVPGLPSARYPTRGQSPSIEASVVGSYELRAEWLLSLPYPPLPR